MSSNGSAGARRTSSLTRGWAPILRPLRSAATWLALVALVLRASVPIGWMSDPAAASPAKLIPCPMMDGMGGMPMPQPKAPHPAKHQLPASHEGSICPFATAAPPVRAIEPQAIEIAPARFAFFGPTVRFFAPDWDHVPRAPPPAT